MKRTTLALIIYLNLISIQSKAASTAVDNTQQLSYPEMILLQNEPGRDSLNYFPSCQGLEKIRMNDRLNNADTLFVGYPDAAERWSNYIDESELALGCTNE